MNPNKAVSANSKGIVVTFLDVNKHKFVYYNNNDVVKDIQINGTVKYQNLETVEFNKTQKRLYEQAVYGFKTLSYETIMEMKPQQIKRFQETHNKAKAIINEYKQEISNNKIDALLASLFPKSGIVKQMLNIKGTDPSIKIPISLKDLKITPRMLAEKLVEYGVLPQNFFKLT
jgi:hypothetical protein